MDYFIIVDLAYNPSIHFRNFHELMIVCLSTRPDCMTMIHKLVHCGNFTIEDFTLPAYTSLRSTCWPLRQCCLINYKLIFPSLYEQCSKALKQFKG